MLTARFIPLLAGVARVSEFTEMTFFPFVADSGGIGFAFHRAWTPTRGKGSATLWRLSKIQDVGFIRTHFIKLMLFYLFCYVRLRRFPKDITLGPLKNEGFCLSSRLAKILTTPVRSAGPTVQA